MYKIWFKFEETMSEMYHFTENRNTEHYSNFSSLHFNLNC